VGRKLRTDVRESRTKLKAWRPSALIGALFVMSLFAVGCGSDSELTAAREDAAAARAEAADATAEAAASASEAAASAAAAAAATAPAPLSESTVRWAGFGGMAELLFFVADDAGHFEAEGLEVERIELGGGTNLFSALASGSVAFTQLGTQHGIKAVGRGLDFRGIYGFSHGPNEFGVISPEAAAAAGITNDSTLAEKFEALRGLKIGTGRPGSTTTTLAIGAMEQRASIRSLMWSWYRLAVVERYYPHFKPVRSTRSSGFHPRHRSLGPKKAQSLLISVSCLSLLISTGPDT